ncbi:MAG: zinc-dependent metalloprotease [Planctomycetales bacterium]|nr:zinc-dependent metalloprotease [Planctomycetales bacterium]
MQSRSVASSLVAAAFALSCSLPLAIGDDYPPFDKVIEGYTLVEPEGDESQSMYKLYVKPKEGQLLIELPKAVTTSQGKKYFVGLTVASGQVFAGLQAGDFYVQWRMYNKRMALIAPNLDIRSEGDTESRDSVNRLFTGRVLLDLPILAQSPAGGILIDGDQLLVANATVFFGSAGQSRNPGLAKLIKHKAFKENIELAFELPNRLGNLQTLYYSISEIPTNTGYKPRVADQRVGYFTTSYDDYGKYKEDDVEVNYINRWHLVKRDPSLKISPPVEPIRFYIEHTTPVRYRRWVKEGVLYWNKAFEKVGISDAIIVEYQDKSSNTHMDKDPEDVRYNFIRWLNNNVSTAIGPSRVHPETGQILDADIILTDGWIRYFNEEFADYMPLLAMEGMSAETIAWLAEHPNWDPRVRFAEPSQRQHVASQIRSKINQPHSGSLPSQLNTKLMGDDVYDGLIGRTSQVNGLCLAAAGRRIDTTVMRMIMAMGPEVLLAEEEMAAKGRKKKKANKENEDGEDEEKEKDAEAAQAASAAAEKPASSQESADKKDNETGEDEKDEPNDSKKSDETMLDGMPESFIGPLLADLVAHEVGHTLGLRHNFKASSIYTLEEINSEEVKGKKPFAGSVMDYLPINLRLKEGKVQGDYAMIDIGPYDFWAIEYGYTFDNKALPKILERVSERELQFSTDEDTAGPDPLARRYDFSANPLDYVREQSLLIERFRANLMNDYVKKGESWTKARRGYELTLSLQMRNSSMMANWLGGAYVHRDKKGDPNERLPIEVVSAQTQRDALKFVLESTFRDKSYALSPDLLARLTKDFFAGYGSDPAWPVHDRILAMQASTLTSILNSATLRGVYDNEFRTPDEQDAFTLPELLQAVTDEIWSELKAESNQKYSARQPMISSLRRNLQREHLERLIDLTLPGNGSSAAYKAISNLCMIQLTELQEGIGRLLEATKDTADPYSKAHLVEAKQRITKALDADYVYNQSSGAGGIPIIFFAEEAEGGEAEQ